MYSTVVVACHCLAAGAQSAAHYDIFAGATLATTRWTFTSYYFANRKLTAQADGTLPRGVSYVVNHTGPIEYEVWRGCLEGTVSLLPGAALVYTHSARLQYEQRVSTTPEIWQLVTNDYLTRFRVDDYANEPADTLHLGALVVQTTWSENNGWVAGYLHAEETWYNDYLPADVDVVRVDTGVGVYCVETDKDFIDFSGAALTVVVFKKKAGKDEYDGEYIAQTNKFNVYSDNGYLDNARQRVYFTLDNANGAYVQVSLVDPSKASKYNMRVFRARPIILVHGIDSQPRTQAEARAGKNTMGNWEDCLPWDAQAYPCVCYNFAWDSAQDNLRHDNAGKILGIIQQDPGEADNPYVGKLYDKHGMNVVLIGHSMGGYLVRYALKYSANQNRIYKAVLLGSPLYGSDVALGPVRQPVPWLKNTSTHNLRMLRRASIFATEMHLWAGAEKCLCIAGQGAPPRVRIPFIPYERGLGHGDGVVPVSSALLVGADNRIFSGNHGTVGLATYEIGRQNKLVVFTDAIYKTVRDCIK